ncbi:uncharacterized protein LOC114534852 [Dendronephthya gigantea]|uniref:uncharacterized protein LOC114534852 n=1 Tax=Dendronephthya gigantea TaxID=151771 RepID=UPI001069CDED|nr:uncharacterized protein LOC114534852 [Dendronephthya gigantea]
MAYFRNNNWVEDEQLKEQMARHVREGYQRNEMLDFLRRDFPQYAWSIRTLDRRLSYFELKRTDRNVTVDQVKEAVQKELNGPGQLLGYRAMQKKVRQEHNLNVPRDLVHAVMGELDPEGLEQRGGVGLKKNKRGKGNFTTKGPNWVHSLDGHDKLMGYQNSTFPLAVYGCIDSASRKLLWLRIWVSNSDPKIIGRWYLDYLYENMVIASIMRLDKGTETGIMATMHAFLRRNHGDMESSDTVVYGPSTSNQIERWWRELHERLEKYFKHHLNWLKDSNEYNPFNPNDRKLLAFLMIPVLQKELDIFKESVWNTHRIRAQKNTNLPDGIPNHIYSFPELYGFEDKGWAVTEEELKAVAIHSGVLEVPTDFLENEFRAECERVLPYPDRVEPSECKDTFLYLKQKCNFQ